MVEGGVEFAGTVYRSLSAAAVAAARSLGLSATSINGNTYWGLKKPARAAGSGRDPLQAHEKAWSGYRARINLLLGDDATDEARARVVDAVKKHAASLERVGECVA